MSDQRPIDIFWPICENLQKFILNSIELFAEDCVLVDLRTKDLSMVKTTVKTLRLTNYEEAENLVHSSM